MSVTFGDCLYRQLTLLPNYRWEEWFIAVVVNFFVESYIINVFYFIGRAVSVVNTRLCC